MELSINKAVQEVSFAIQVTSTLLEKIFSKYIMILWSIAYFVACVLVGVYGSDRRFGFLGSFLGALFTTPLLAFLILLMTKKSKYA